MQVAEATKKFALESGRLRTEKSRTSFHSTMDHMRRYIGFEVQLEEITPQMLTEWCLSVPKGKRSAAPSTIKKRRGHARSFFGWCAYKGWIETDPSSGLGYSVNPGSGVVRTHTWLTQAEAAELIGNLPTDPIGTRDRIALMLGVLCGLRASEICDVRWKDFNADFTTLSVVGKGQKPEVIGVPTDLGKVLKAWHEQRPPGTNILLPTVMEYFTEGERRRMLNWHKRLEYDGLLYIVKQLGKRAGHKLAPHDLRRSFAGILEELGTPVTDIQRAMRHSNVGTTSRYLESNSRRTVEATKGLTLGL